MKHHVAVAPNRRGGVNGLHAGWARHRRAVGVLDPPIDPEGDGLPHLNRNATGGTAWKIRGRLEVKGEIFLDPSLAPAAIGHGKEQYVERAVDVRRAKNVAFRTATPGLAPKRRHQPQPGVSFPRLAFAGRTRHWQRPPSARARATRKALPRSRRRRG